MTRRNFNLFCNVIVGSMVLIVFFRFVNVDPLISRASEIQNEDSSITVMASIATGVDDVVEKVNSGATILNYRYVYPGRKIILGFRFNSVDVPANAKILSAKLLQYSSGYEGRSVRLKYIGQASAEPAPFTGEAYDLSLRPRTLSYVIDAPEPWPRYDFFPSPELAPIIQEIIDDPQWRRAGTMTLFLEDADSESSRKIDQYEYDPLHAARLQITYIPAETEPVDVSPPEIQILIPAPEFQTDQPAVNLSGTASDDSGVERIDWQTDGGDSGSIEGTNSWFIPDIPLRVGTNTITVSAFDPAGNRAETSIIVYRTEAPTEPPAERRLITVTVAEGTDDSFEKTYNRANNVAGKAILIGKGYWAGFRFPDVRIPAGSVVTKATLLLHCYTGESKDIHIRYTGEATPNSEPFSSAVGDIGRRSRTVAGVSEYTPVWDRYSFNTSADLKEIIQEIIDQPGWQSGNALSLFVEDIDSSKYRNVTAVEKDSAKAATLKIEYVPFLGSRATISAQPTQVAVGEAVAFHAEFTDPGKVLEWIWRFGDGETSVELDPVHYYTAAGSYPVRFEFTDIYSNQFYETIDVQVGPDPSFQPFEGFGETTTGGKGFPTWVAGSETQFADMLSRLKLNGGNAVILLKGDWTYSSKVSLAHLSNLTINGMDSSVTFDGSSFYLIDCENVILQGLRIRKHQTGDDAIQVNSCRNVVIDHCSVSEAGDGNIDITGYSYGPSTGITVSWCILADTWKQSLVKYGGTTNVTFHHNLFYNGGGRFPALHEGVFDIRNNVMYQWASYGLVLANGAQANIVNNSFIISPTSTRGHAAIWYTDGMSKAWIEGNILPAKETDTSRLPGPLDVPEVLTQSARESRELILNQAGALPRDTYDQKIIQMIRDNLFPPYPPYHD